MTDEEYDDDADSTYDDDADSTYDDDADSTFVGRAFDLDTSRSDKGTSSTPPVSVSATPLVSEAEVQVAAGSDRTPKSVNPRPESESAEAGDAYVDFGFRREDEDPFADFSA